MTFRSPEYVQRNELVQFRLQDAIRAPANTQEQIRKDTNFMLLIGVLCLIGLTPF